MGGVVTGSSSTGGVWSAVANIAVNILSSVSFKKIRDRAKANKALKIALAGGYDSLTPYQKSLISVDYASGSYIATPEKAGIDPASILIFVVILFVGVLVFRQLRR